MAALTFLTFFARTAHSPQLNPPFAARSLWWPFLMSPTPGYLYDLTVTATDSAGTVDSYPLRVGLRTVTLAGASLLINGVPLYMRGFGKHEDAAYRGKGMDQPTIIRDSFLLQWFSANSFRTSHYPYSDEIMDAADEFGIVVIDESPGVGLEEQNLALNATLAHHLAVEAEHVRRDKNRACVIAFSVANEPQSNTPPAAAYFAAVIGEVRALDPTRPVMFVCDQDFATDLAMPFSDIIGIKHVHLNPAALRPPTADPMTLCGPYPAPIATRTPLLYAVVITRGTRRTASSMS